MSSATVNFPPLRAGGPLSRNDHVIDPDAHRMLLKLYNGHPLQTLSTTGGNATFPVPLAAANQNVEITFIKISADAHTPTLAASGSDKINTAGAWAGTTLTVGTAQGSKVKLKSDGVSNWYQVG